MEIKILMTILLMHIGTIQMGWPSLLYIWLMFITIIYYFYHESTNICPQMEFGTLREESSQHKTL